MKKAKLKPVDLAKAMNDIKEMLLATHNVQQIRKDFKYTGEEITHHSVLAISFNIRESVSRNGMQHNRDQNRTLLDMILLKTFQLGYSHAMIINDNDDTKNFLLDFAMKSLENLSKDLKK